MDLVQSRDIPDQVKREARQRCGFGCVVCGTPLYEYEHMLGFANVRRHRPDEITLLCDRHHRERTAGLLPVEAVIKANGAPYNLRAGASKPYDLHYSGSECEAIIGGNRFTTSDAGEGTVMIPVSVDGRPLIYFVLSNGHILLNVDVCDQRNRQMLLIHNNELVYSTSPWDIELVGRRLVVREALGRFLIDMVFEVPNKIVIERGKLFFNGVQILIRRNHILIENNETTIR
ncbi:MAG TPA: hypothetical protein VM450_05225, partial [Thermomicrobiales bacterium]|nr:hypothetical protein [Thermomicrobiales bacterium]